MPPSTNATAGRKKTPASPGKPRRKTSKQPARSRSTLRWLWLIVVAVVFLAAYILDWSAVAQLLWACLMGQLGLTPRLVSFAIVLMGATALVVTFRGEPVPPPAKKRSPTPRARKKPAQPKPAPPDNPVPVEPG
jgi:flagellar basal body-associated protein FliL